MKRRTLFFFNDPATTEIYTLSLHDALPICQEGWDEDGRALSVHLYGTSVRYAPADVNGPSGRGDHDLGLTARDRKSTRLNSSHANISYAVFCLKKKECRLLRE